jgi:hypothetical protein
MRTKGGVKMKRQWLLGTASVVPLALILIIIGVSGAQREVSAGPAATLVVNSPADSGPGTLRQAMQDAVSGDTIVFDPVVFPPGTPVTISITSEELPAVALGNLAIDGTGTGVILDGSDLDPGPGGHGDGIWIPSSGNVISGLQILNFPGDGIDVGGDNNIVVNNVVSGHAYGGVSIRGTDNLVIGNLIGTDASGTMAKGGNFLGGVNLGGGAQYNTIGGDTPEERNVISGNDGDGIWIGDSGTDHNTVSGNYMGTDISGTTAVGGGNILIINGPQYNTIGGSNAMPGGICSGACNLISGNGGGVAILTANHNVVSGNYIGTDTGGTSAIPNGRGIWIANGAQYNTIGGTTPEERNIISGNNDPIGGPGIWIEGQDTDYNLVTGNYIGTDVNGTAAIPNNGGGVAISGGASYNTVGGDTSEERNLISGNTGGIGISGSHNVIIGNYIGTDITGMDALGNGGGVGIEGAYNRIGGSTPGERNIISGNDAGAVYISGSTTMSNTVSGNLIGSNVNGTAPVPNGWGVQIWNSAHHNTIGGDTPSEANLISGNNGDAVIINDYGTTFNTVSGNLIGTDLNGAVPLSNAGHGISMGYASSHNTIGGSTPGARNLVSGNGGDGIHIDCNDVVSNTIIGNYIGTDLSGTTAISNTGHGVGLDCFARYNLITGNLVSGNGDNGISISGFGTVSNTVSGNFIGTDAAGTSALPNSGGIVVSGGTQYNRIGGDTPEERNLISGNIDDGIALQGRDSGHNSITGNYIGMDASGTFTIPNGYYGINIESSYNTIGGINATAGGACSGACNLISGNCYGLQIVAEAISNTVTGNYVGTDATGTVPVAGPCGDQSNGIYLGSNVAHNRIGGTTEGERNVLAGTLWFGPPDAHPRDNWIAGNFIGVGATGATSVANGYHGISLVGSDNLIGGDVPGAGNLISGFIHDGISISGAGNRVAHNEIYGNAEHGVQVTGATALTNTLSQNSIYANSGLGIDLVDGGNSELSAPVVLTYDTTAGTAGGIACPGCTVELFSDEGDEGRWFEGAVTADASGDWSFDKGSAFVGLHVHATTTDGAGNTSEFSAELRDVAVVGATPDGQAPLGEAVAVRAELFNAGHQAEDQVPVGCSVEDPTGDTVYDENALSGEIPPGTWALVNFPAWTPSQEGAHLLTCQSQLPDDQDPTNDLFTQTMTVVLCAPDVWTKDNEDDTGDVPTDPPWFWSPDLWVRNLPDGGLEHQNPIPGVENTLYIRLRNRGCATAQWGEVHLFAGPSKLGWSCLGSEPNVGTIPFENLTSGEERILSITWIPDGGPYLSLRSVIEATGDPAQWQPGCSPHQPRFDNNISWRNVHVIDNRADLLQRGMGVKQVEVVLNNVYDWPNDVDLIVERMTFPVTGTITVTLSSGLFDRWLANDGHGSEGIEVLTATKEIRVTGIVSATIGAIPMTASEEATIALAFDGPTGLKFELGLQERIHDLAVGGVIFQWIVPEGGYEIYLPLVLRNR